MQNKRQDEALELFVEHFYENKNKKGQINACCAYGKTYYFYKLIDHCIINYDERIFVYITSRILLMNQAANVFESFVDTDEIICMRLGDGNSFSLDELQYFLSNDNYKYKIIFTTYNSAHKIRNAIYDYNKNLRKKHLIIDLIIFDEAHNTTSHDDKFHQKLIVTDKWYDYNKCIFASATSTKLLNIKIKNNTYSMDNINIYGEVYYSYSFKQGIQDKIINDFEVIKSSDKYIKNMSEETKEMIKDKDNKLDIYLKYLAKFLMESIKKYNLKKVIVYLSNKQKVSKYHKFLDKYNDLGCEIFDIVCSDSSKSRDDKETLFVGSNIGIILSVNIYNEGVNIPCVDSVLFGDEKKIESVIIQNIGRCIRIDKNNVSKKSYVLIPSSIYKILSKKFTLDDKNDNNFKKIYEMIKCIKNDDENNCKKLCPKD